MVAISISSKQFAAWMKEKRLVLVDYWAPWCGYCRRIGPAYDRVAEERKDTLPLVKINIDEEAALADAQQIEVIPTLVLYQDGEAVASIVAPDSKAAIDAFLNEALANR